MISEVEFTYPWQPPKCKTFGKWFHLDTVCMVQKGMETAMQETSTRIEYETNQCSIKAV